MIGQIYQYRPGLGNKTITLSQTDRCYIIGVSMDEDDFMSYETLRDQQTRQDFSFYINEEKICLGRTYIYETEHPVDGPVTISFPVNTPKSTIVNVVYCNEYK